MRDDIAKELENSIYSLDGATAKDESNENSVEFEVKDYFTTVENEDDKDGHLGSVHFELGDDNDGDDDDAITSPNAPNRQSIGVNTQLSGVFSPTPQK